MESRSSLPVLIGVGAVAVLSLFAAMEHYRTTALFNERRPDLYRIGFQEPRFREVLKDIPEDAVVGYVSDLPFEDIRGSTAFFGAQYALAPRIVVDSDHPAAVDLVLGNFTPAGERPEPEGMHVVREYDDGVILYRKGEQE